MKKILLRKERDEVSAAATGGSQLPPICHPEVPFSHLKKFSLEENRNVVIPSDECCQNEIPFSEQSGTGMPSIEQSRTGMPSRFGSPCGERGRIKTPSRSEILRVSSLMSGNSKPFPAVPVLMMASSAGVGLGHDNYYLGSTGSAVLGLPPYSFPGYFQGRDSRLQNVSPTRVLQSGRLKDEAGLEESVSHASTSLSILAGPRHEESILPLLSKTDLQVYVKQHGFDHCSVFLPRPGGCDFEDKRTDADFDSVSSSDIMERRKSNSMKTVDIDSEDDSISKWRSVAPNDTRSDLPKTSDKDRGCMRASPLNTPDAFNYSRKENVRSDSVDEFKSPAVENQKSISRPKGRPAKVAVIGDIGPGGRSIIRCPVCGKLFNNSSALAKHKLTHSDERKYACSLCSKAFKRQDHLNGHMMTHSSTKPFGCKFIGCNKSYCDARSLRRHMENHHQECANAAAAAGSSSSYFNFDSSVPQSFGADVTTDKSGSYLQQVSPISPVLRDGPRLSRPFAGFSSSHPQTTMWVTGYNPLDEPKPIKCGVCGRGFKNIPALNGHMRLHGGYVRKDLDESQDVSHGSESRSESRFSLQSESSHSSIDRQHDSLKSSDSLISTSGFSVKPNLSGSEPGKRHFLLRPSSTEGEHLHDGLPSVSNCKPTNNMFNEDFKYFSKARGSCSSAAELKNWNEFGVCNSFEMNHIVCCGLIKDHKDEAIQQCPSPRTASQHDDEDIQRTSGLRRRCAEDKRTYGQMVNIASVNEVPNIPADCSTSPVKDPLSKKSINNPNSLHLQSKSCKQQRKSTDANDISGAAILSESNTVIDRHSVESTGTGCQTGSKLFNQVKSGISCERRIEVSSMSQHTAVKTGEDKFQMLGDECLPDSTSGKEEVNFCRLEKTETYTNSLPKLKISDYEAGLLQAEAVQNVNPDSEVEVSGACKNLSPIQDFACEVPSSQIEQGGCLYRKRWMDLQLKQAGLCYNKHPGIMSTSSTGNQCSNTRVNDGANTDCGEPTSPKGFSKFVENVCFQPGTYKSYTSGNVEASGNVGSNCLPGSHETEFVGVRSGPSTPVQQTDQLSSLLNKRNGSSGLFNYPNIMLHREVTAAVVHGCHNSSFACREGLHHVHSNSCITQVDGIQPNVPSSPYDLHPHTPCAAHTPYTPCQTYTPHSPYTPLNHPGTPKHASHFEFPPRECLLESSMCDSPFSAHGGQMQRSNQPLDVCLIVEPDDDHYMSQQRPKIVDTETEFKCLRQLSQDEPLYRKVMEKGDLDKQYRVQHAMFDGNNISHVLAQRTLEARKLSSGSQGQVQNSCQSLIQNEARNPDDGMSASLPTGAKRDCCHEAAMRDELDSLDEKNHDKKMERKRKPSGESESESGHKRPVVRSSGGETSSNVDIQAKQENIEPWECDGNLPKSFPDHKNEIIFRNPPSPLKVKKPKPRPEPLFIPANVNHMGFQSRLRSPRLWDGLTKQAPPPYTPPPMLSPARSGPGLFWTLHSGYHSPLALPPVLSKYGKSKTGKCQYEDTESVIELEKEPPETDTQPHINIGSQYQPDLPNFHGCKSVLRDYSEYDDHSSLVWNPVAMNRLSDDEVTHFMDYACCAAIPGNGVNKEYALHLLHMCNGDMKKAGRLLLEPQPKLPRSSGLTAYKYQECVKWKKSEIELFHRAITKVDKDFFQIAKLVSTKTVKDCVQFYYLWKKICPDESKQLKLLRRKREQLELYSRRSKDLHDQPPPSKPCVQQTRNSCTKTSVLSELKKDVKEDSIEFHYQTSSDTSNSQREEKIEDNEKRWCTFCKRSFTSARNFSVHMKKHQQNTLRKEPAELSQTVKLPYPALNSVF